MKYITVLILCLGAVGCATGYPSMKVIAENENSVAVSASGPGSGALAASMELAGSSCAKHNRKAKLIRDDRDGFALLFYYDCV